MKGQGFTETFPSIHVPSVISHFIFGHWVVIYFIMQSLLKEKKKTYLVFLLSEKICTPPSYLFPQQPQQLLRKPILWNLFFVDTFCRKSKLKSHFCVYTPNFEEVDGAYWQGCVSVHPSVLPAVQEPCMLGFWNFIYGFLMEKYLTHIFFSCPSYLLF